MPDKPAAEVEIDEALVRRLLTSQASAVIPDAATSPLSLVAEGWDSAVWRLGDSYAVRLPRRALAAPLMRHEQQALPVIARRVEPTGVGVPLPAFAGSPDGSYRWPWSVVPWFHGESGLGVPRRLRRGWAGPLARALTAMHVPAPADHPVNPVRGRALETRAHAVAERLDGLRSAVPQASLDAAATMWQGGLSASPYDGEPVWIHGDLHPGNLVARGTHLVAMIDFGDVTGGDPAYDLAIAWLAFDEQGRSEFIAATQSRYDDATWTRARAWAVAVALLLLFHSDDNPEYAALGAEALGELTRR